MTRRLARLVVMLVAAMSFLIPGIATASIGGHIENRVSVIDVMMHVVVGSAAPSRPEEHRGNDGLRSGAPSRATRAAEVSTAEGVEAAGRDLAALEEGEGPAGTLSSAAASSDGSIAAHSADHWPNLTQDEIVAKIQQVRDTGTPVVAPNGNKFTYLRDGTILIEDFTSLDGGTIFKRPGNIRNYLNAWLEQNR